jgi:hypothetical protein
MEGVAWSVQRIPPVVSLGFLDRVFILYCIIKASKNIITGLMTSNHLESSNSSSYILSKNFVVPTKDNDTST